MCRVRTLLFSHGPKLKWSWAHLAYFMLAAWRFFVCVYIYIYNFFSWNESVFAPTGIDANPSADLSRAGPHSFPAQPSSTVSILGQEKDRVQSPSPLLRKTSTWDAVVVVSSAGAFQTSGNIFSLPGILGGLRETSPVTRCQLLVCHGGSVADPVWGISRCSYVSWMKSLLPC